MPQEVQDAVHDHMRPVAFWRTVFSRLPADDRRANGDVAEYPLLRREWRGQRKRKDIGGTFNAAKLGVEGTPLGFTKDAHT